MLKAIITATTALSLAGCIIDMGPSRAAEGIDRAERPVPEDRGPIGTRSFALADFDTIELAGCDRVEVLLGDRFAVIARAPQRDLDLLDATRAGSTLRLRRVPKGCNGEQAQATYTITLPTLARVAISGSGAMALPAIERDRFEARLSGSARLDLAALHGGEAEVRQSGSSAMRLRGASLNNLALDISGASQATVSGSAGRLSIQASGASEVDARALDATTLSASASGTAAVEAKAGGTAALTASGMSTIGVAGGAACTVQKSGMARATCNGSTNGGPMP